MNEWMNPWFWAFKSPLSGDVEQSIAPVTQWWSPQLEVNIAGDRKLEARIIAEVASYGSQLGTLTDAVLELAEGKDSETIRKLQDLANQIDSEKRRYQHAELTALKRSLLRLKRNDPKGFEQLMTEVQPAANHSAGA